MSTEQNDILKLVTASLTTVLKIPLKDLELAVQHAHQCNRNDIQDPPERFVISRKALRMLWQFRRNIENIQVFTSSK